VINLEGVALSPGVTCGAAITFRPASTGQPSCQPPNGSGTLEQFRTARRDAEAELRRALATLPRTDGPAHEILRAHLALLADPVLVSEVESRIARDRVGALMAVEQTAAALASQFGALADPAMRHRAADLHDVCEYIRRHLISNVPTGSSGGGGRVVFASELSPAQVLCLAQEHPLAFVLESGTDMSHAAILMRALAVPAVIGVPGAMAVVHDGDVVIVDGNRGQIFVRPDPDASLPTTTVFSVACESDRQPAVTRDGVSIAVTATIADATDARRAIAAGADGIGLFRTEMLFLRGSQLPSEDAQEAFYREVARAIGSRELTARILDLGMDKQSAALRLAAEPNPALGLRGVRLLFAHPELLMGQLRALLRATAGRRIRLLVPMVVDGADLERMREMIADARRSIAPAAAEVNIGVMVETPAAAVMAEELAAAADFMSIGTNDLAQYVLAADRNNARMARFYQPLHPAVLRLVRGACVAAARRGIPVAVCGEAAADPRALSLFVGMGATELSVRPSAVVDVKAKVRRIVAAAARALAEEAAALSTAAAVIARIEAAEEAEPGIDVREAGNPH
jgi:phosphoenolpyruvate-protein phosphotransferase